MVRLIVVRHGETLINVPGRFTGQLDVLLSTLGGQQAEALGWRLSTARLDVIVAFDHDSPVIDSARSSGRGPFVISRMQSRMPKGSLLTAHFSETCHRC